MPPRTTHLNLQVRLLLQRSCRRHVKLRLIEQACGCSTVRGRGGLKEDTRVCVLVSGTLVVESQDHALPTAVVIAFATEPPPLCKAHPTDRASLPLLHGARRRRPQGGAACSSLPLALIQWRVLATKAHALAPAGAFALSAETPPCEATTDRASLRLLHGARWRRPQGGACSSLRLALLRWRVLATNDHALAPAGAVAFETELPPPCEATTDRASSWLLHGARRRRHQGGACHLRVLATGTTHLHLQVRLLLQRSRRRHVKQRLIEQACGCSTVRGCEA